MLLRQLNYFIAVVETGSFTRAVEQWMPRLYGPLLVERYGVG